MNINDLTIGQAKELANIFGSDGGNGGNSGLQAMVGKKCIIRTYSAGVWFGEVIEKAGMEVIVKNARRMYTWHTKKSISLSSVALHGINQSKSEICEAVELVNLEAIELIPCTCDAIVSIESATVAEAS